MSRQTPSHSDEADLLATLRHALDGAAHGDTRTTQETGAEATGGAGCCAWAIDAAEAVVLAANEAGAACLGMRGPEISLAIDAAMPAVVRLRELASRQRPRPEASATTPGEPRHEPCPPDASFRETLLFWTPSGSCRVDCSVAALPGHPGILVVRATGPQAPPPKGPSHESAPCVADEAASPPRIARDDAETLREIARRIREGQGRHTPGKSSAAPTGTTKAPATQTGNVAAGHAGDVSHAELSGEGGGLDIARLAHELKTPISAIVAASEIMRDEQLGPIGNERYRGYASDIHDSARHALAVIANMLIRQQPTHTRGPGGTAAAEPQLFAQIDLDALVESTVSGMAPLAAKHDVGLSTRLTDRLPNIIADPVSVRQILLNLLTNAVKFSPSGGRVTVETRYSVDGPVAIAVRDTGPGMAADDIARVLSGEPAAPRMPREGGGLGIGLPLVRQLAEANGAVVDIESTQGSGTTVVVTFAKGRVVPV